MFKNKFLKKTTIVREFGERAQNIITKYYFYFFAKKTTGTHTLKNAWLVAYTAG